MMSNLELQVTLWPSFPHFEKFAFDDRISAIRLNSAQMELVEIDRELEIIDRLNPTVPLFYDVKGRQLRVDSVDGDNTQYLDLTLNHPISVNTPTPVLFKAGSDYAKLLDVIDGGYRLIFDGGPDFAVRRGESLHIRDKSLRSWGPQFTEAELEKIDKVKKFGFKRYFLSYVQSKADVDEFVNLVGSEAEVYLKIEDQKGLQYVANEFVKTPNLKLVAARGDLYVEVDKPHEALAAQKLIIEKDPEALVGSRILLSVIQNPYKELRELLCIYQQQGLSEIEVQQILLSLVKPTVPDCVDFSELAWLYDIGYKKMLICDEICLNEGLLDSAINAFEAFKKSYAAPALLTPTTSSRSLRSLLTKKRS